MPGSPYTVEFILEQIDSAFLDDIGSSELDTSQTKSKVVKSGNKSNRNLNYWKNILRMHFPHEYFKRFGRKKMSFHTNRHGGR